MTHVRSVVAVSVLVLSGCATRQRCCCDPCATACLPTAPVPATAATPDRAPTVPARSFAFYDGSNGSPTTLDAFLDRARDADLVAFGELHGHPIGAEMELKVLTGLAAGPRPVVLAMEFFERDVQGALDDYLAGRTTEAEFAKLAKQGPAYAATHRPLIEFAKAHRMRVLAANAPRRLVTDYRKSDKPYAEYLAGLPAADRALLPAETTVATGPYLDRFHKLMGGERGPKLIKAQSLWDDAMADSIAAERTAHPESRVMLVVGGFHVAGRLGTITQFSARRPNDRIGLLLMSQGEPPALAFDPDDRGEGDVILAVAPVAPRPFDSPVLRKPSPAPAPGSPAVGTP